MNNPLKTPSAANLGFLLGRLPLGVLFAVASYHKLKAGVGSFVSHNASSLPDFLPRPIGETYLYAVPYLELFVGLVLITGLYVRWGAFVAAAMLVSFSIAVTGFWDASKGGPTANVVYLGLALLLLMNGGGDYTVARLYAAGGGGGGKRSGPH